MMDSMEFTFWYLDLHILNCKLAYDRLCLHGHFVVRQPFQHND